LGAALLVTANILAQGIPSGTPHSVALSWTAPSQVGGSGTVSGYNVYRAAGVASAAATLTFTKINAALNSGVTFTDAGAAAGTTYSYCVTTVDSLGGESACSGVTSAAVPTNPNAPSAPLITVK
jgi:fibronectin type 3 domain-containing protein